MMYKALVVEDDDDIAADVADILESLGHTFDRANCLEQARALLASERYDYFLMDLNIPVRAGRSYARVENGINLIAEVRERTEAPIIVMTSHGKNSPELAVKTLKKGAVDFISKPLPTSGETLDQKILEALDRHARRTDLKPKAQPRPEVALPLAERGEPTQFDGGELLYRKHQIELKGVRICGSERNGNYRQLFEALRRTNSFGKRGVTSTDELVELLQLSDPSKVHSLIKDLREHIQAVLLEAANTRVGKQDVIRNARKRGGYFLPDWIIVRDEEGDDAAHDEELNGEVIEVFDDLEDAEDPTAAERRRRILGELAKESRRAPAIAKTLKCSTRTVQRDLEALRRVGRVTFVGSPKTGGYCLTG